MFNLHAKISGYIFKFEALIKVLFVYKICAFLSNNLFKKENGSKYNVVFFNRKNSTSHCRQAINVREHKLN